ncbi:PAS domain S-box-containing protein [Streptomyces sp. SolWspMP-5a-2]|nr:PAS domain S-box-containing protein [Streptomyces sp. SolWspMP-5a-2]
MASGPRFLGVAARRRQGPGRRRAPLLSRLRVGHKLLLLVLLPVTGLVALTAFGALAQWEEARTLERFRSAIDVSFATSGVSDAVATERVDAVRARLRPDTATLTARSASRQATDRALDGAVRRADSWPTARTGGELDAVSRQLSAVRVQAGLGALTARAIAQQYQEIQDTLLDTATALETGRPTRAAGRAADAHVAILEAVEAAERERVELAVLLDTPTGRRPAAAGRWSALEEAQLREFRRTTSDRLRAALYQAQFEVPGRAVRAVRDLLADPDPPTARWPSYGGWLADSTARIAALRGIQDEAARDLADTAAADLEGARNRAARDLTVSLAVLTGVALLAFVLARSITRPLREVTAGARALSAGDLSFAVHYAGHDELGDVADTFRELRVTTERLAAEIRSMNSAVDDNRLEHRVDVGRFDGTWAQLLGGMNGTMASFAAAHGRRRKAERELEDIFNLSLDLLCILGVDGSFRRVNPAFERTLGYPRATLLARHPVDLVHEEDRERTRAALELLAGGAELAGFENRYVREDGTECWLQWSARPVPEEGLVYAAARDVTERRRAAREQSALRRVATLVARGATPERVFGAVAAEVEDLLGAEVAAVLRHESDGTLTVLGTAHGTGREGEAAAREVLRTRAPARVGRSVAAPIAVDGRLWGAVVATTRRTPRPAPDPTPEPVSGAVPEPAPRSMPDPASGPVLEPALRPPPDPASGPVPEPAPQPTPEPASQPTPDPASKATPEPVPPDASRLADFTELVAAAVANADSRAQLSASRARVVAAGDASRRRIERDLHDGVQQRLVALQLDLRLAESLVADPSSELGRQLAHVAKGLEDASYDLLQVARGIHPAILSKGGLGPALRSLARRCPVLVELDLALPARRLPERLEVAAYYVVSECLTNAVKHAHARVVTVDAHARGDVLELTVRDDGAGGAEPGRGSGLIGLVDRVEAIGGRLDLRSPPGQGTTLRVTAPLEGPPHG